MEHDRKKAQLTALEENWMVFKDLYSSFCMKVNLEKVKEGVVGEIPGVDMRRKREEQEYCSQLIENLTCVIVYFTLYYFIWVLVLENQYKGNSIPSAWIWESFEKLRKYDGSMLSVLQMMRGTTNYDMRSLSSPAIFECHSHH